MSITNAKVNRLIKMTSEKYSINTRGCAARILITLFTGVSEKYIEDLSLDVQGGWLKFRGYEFIPYSESASASFLDIAEQSGAIEYSQIDTLISECLKPFVLNDKVEKLFLSFLDLSTQFTQEKYYTSAICSRVGISQKYSELGRPFKMRVESMNAPAQLKSMFFLPWLKPEGLEYPFSTLPDTFDIDTMPTTAEIGMEFEFEG